MIKPLGSIRICLMAFCEISSDELVIKINSKGAELAGLYKKGHQHNWIWSADEPWCRSAPHLFPIVGKLSGDTYRYGGAEYRLSQHGFARDSEFEIVVSEPSMAIFRLASTATLKDFYPFDFILEVFYQVKKSTLVVGYRVQNTDKRKMYFNIGWHPGLVLPDQDLLPLRITGEGGFGPCHFLRAGLLDEKHSSQIAKGTTVDIGVDSFTNDAWVFVKDIPEQLEISDSRGNVVVMTTGRAPFLGVWSKDPSKFICIEPWWGVADLTGFAGSFETKYGIQSLDSGQEWRAEMSVEIRGADEGC